MNPGTPPSIEELGYGETVMGELVLRRRMSPSVRDMVYEITIDGEMLMSSTVNSSERALATLALDALPEKPLEVLVGGLGLGCTAAAVLEYPLVSRLMVVELFEPVIKWHLRGLVPAASGLVDDPRCSFLQGDFFEFVKAPGSEGGYDAVLVDIDHSPDSLLHARHGGFYEQEGLRGVARLLKPGGLFALWSAWRPEEDFLQTLRDVFSRVNCHDVRFYNPHISSMDTNCIIISGTGGE